jgi:Ras family.
MEYTFLLLHLLLSFCRVTQIKTYSWDNAQVILVGNKCDMEDERVISYERGKQLAEQLGIEFFETSAKENINVKVTHNENECYRKIS